MRSGSAKVPDGARIIDASKMTIIPGFIDTHAHWSVRHSVLDLQTWSFFANLAYGVTAGRDPQTGTNDMFAYQDLIDTGDLVGPRASRPAPASFPPPTSSRPRKWKGWWLATRSTTARTR